MVVRQTGKFIAVFCNSLNLSFLAAIIHGFKKLHLEEVSKFLIAQRF